MLSPKNRQHLKQIAHAQKPVIHVGKKGFSSALSIEVEAALLTHELIKIKFLESASSEQDKLIDQLCNATESELVECKGHIATLYKAHPEKPRLL